MWQFRWRELLSSNLQIRFMMSSLDVIIRGGQVVTPAEVRKADIGILNGRIVELGPTIPYSARETIDASGLHVFPGLIDSHVHFNEPGREKRADRKSTRLNSRHIPLH